MTEGRNEAGDEEDVSKGLYGSYGLVQSVERKKIKFVDIKDISAKLDENEVQLKMIKKKFF